MAWKGRLCRQQVALPRCSPPTAFAGCLPRRFFRCPPPVASVRRCAACRFLPAPLIKNGIIIGQRIPRRPSSYRWGRKAKGATNRMEIKVYKDTVTAAQSICDTKLELPIEAEMLIPDCQMLRAFGGAAKTGNGRPADGGRLSAVRAVLSV